MGNRSLLNDILKILHVKHTSFNANRLYNRHPNKYNFEGISQLLYMYGIDNVAYNISDKNIIYKLPTPFISNFGTDFIIIKSIRNNEITYNINGRIKKKSVETYLEKWSGNVLLIEKSEQSIEPDYKNNKQIEYVYKIFILLFLTCTTSIIVHNIYNLFNNSISLNLSLLILNLVGITICYLLLDKDLNPQNSYSDKICKNINCNNKTIKSSIIFKININWSEIGFSYFIGNLIIILFYNEQIPWLFWVNVLTLPFSIWSISYQYKNNAWCMLCIITQIVIWCIFLINIIFNHFYIPSTILFDFIYVIFAYLSSLFIVYFVITFIKNNRLFEKLAYDLNRIKTNKIVCDNLLKKQTFINLCNYNTTVKFENKISSSILTIITNPHCEYCSNIHAQIDLLLKYKNIYQINYIFSSFSENLESSTKALIAAYFQYDNDYCKIIYNEWFSSGK